MLKKKAALVIFALFLQTASSFASDTNSFFKDFHLSAEFDAKIRTGSQTEEVLLSVDGGKQRTLSSLEWEQKPLFIPKAQITTGWKNLCLSFFAETALPAKCGSVFDSDWMNVSSFPDCDDEYALIKTNYSESDCINDSYLKGGGTLLYKFNATPQFSLSPFVQVNVSYSKFTAKGGWASYYDTSKTESNGYFGEYNGKNSYHLYFSGDIMSLERLVYESWLGLKVKADVTQKLSLGWAFAANIFTDVESLDSHLLKNTYYLDELYSNWNGIKAGADLTYAFSGHSAIVLGVEGTWIFPMEGSAKATTVQNASYNEYADCSGWENGKYYKYKSGASFSFTEFSIGYKYTFK